MTVHHTLVHHGNDDRRIARAQLPSRIEIDIASRFNRNHKLLVSRILILPLFIQIGIVEPGLFIATGINVITDRIPNLVVRDDFRLVPKLPTTKSLY